MPPFTDPKDLLVAASAFSSQAALLVWIFKYGILAGMIIHPRECLVKAPAPISNNGIIDRLNMVQCERRVGRTLIRSFEEATISKISTRVGTVSNIARSGDAIFFDISARAGRLP